MYIRLQVGKVAQTREIIDDALIADFDSRGRLLGMEILAPVKLTALTRLVQANRRIPFRRFVRENAPSCMVVA